MIAQGTPPKIGNMPGWGERLNAQDIEATIAWFQSHWPDEVYQAWTDIDARAR